jgi:hypothetical protein
MSISKDVPELGVFDAHGVFEIRDPQLIDLVSGGVAAGGGRVSAAVDAACADLNGACHNRQCINGYCSQNNNCVEVDNAGCISPNPDIDVMCS